MTFGNGGIADLGGEWTAIHALANERLLVQRGVATANVIHADGSIDRTITFRGGFGEISSLLPLAGGSFLVWAVKAEIDPITGAATSTYQLERHNGDGTLDTTFGDDGVGESTTTIDQDPLIAVQPDDRIVIHTSSGLRRLTAEGDADATFVPPI